MPNAVQDGRRAVWRGALLALSVLAASPAAAAGPADAGGTTLFLGGAGAGGPTDTLRAAVARDGEIRVIVGLRLATRAEAELSAPEVSAQRARLHAVQDRVAARVLGAGAAADGFDFIPYMTMTVDAAALERLLKDPEVASVQIDVANPPLLAQSTKVIHADTVWAKGVNGTGYTVAILDTGVSKTHPMFAGRKVVSEACYSTTNAAWKATSLCPRGVAESTAGGSGLNCPTTLKGCDHGTHVAGIAAGNSTTLDGVARDSKLIAIKVFTRLDATKCTPATAPCVVAYDSDIIKGLQRVAALKARFKIASANMSLGGGSFAANCDADRAAMKAAIDALKAAGIATVIASGNNGFTGTIGGPACISTAIAVGNTRKDDVIARSSNHSGLIKLMAPGSAIKSAVPGGGYALKTGTSMAAPHVAGAFALMRNAVPTAGVDDIVTALSCTGKVVHERDTAAGIAELAPAKPRIDLIGAYNYLKKPPSVARAWAFTRAADALDFTPLAGKWVVGGGRYKQSPIQQGWIGTSVANCNKAITVVAAMTRVDPGTDRFSNTGLVLKATIDYSTKAVSGYWFAYNKCPTDKSGNCTGADEDKPGQAVVWRLDGYSFADRSGGGSLLCQAFVPVRVNGLNTVRVVSNGASHTFSLNGKVACRVNDATYPAGSAMAAAYIADAGGHAYQVDSFRIATIGTGGILPTVIDPAAAAPRPLPAGMTPTASAPAAR